MDQRLTQAQHWLIELPFLSEFKIEPASADASFRRYFRIHSQGETWILMDAPPEKESLSEFIQVQSILREKQIHAPSIIANNQAQGFLLLEDLGDALYLDVINQENANELYSDAIDALVQLQTPLKAQTDAGISTSDIPSYSPALIQQELELFPTWFVARHLDSKLNEKEQQVWSDLTELLISAFEQQPQALVHRDFHSRNLLKLGNDSPGVIDFQDMVCGPITYDLCSIFKDCYIEWPRKQQLSWLEQYLEKSKLVLSDTIEFEQLVKWYDLTGLQRHIKVLGIFCRLNYRDGKNNYLNDLPLVKQYVFEVCEVYPELKGFKNLMDRLNA